MFLFFWTHLAVHYLDSIQIKKSLFNFCSFFVNEQNFKLFDYTLCNIHTHVLLPNIVFNFTFLNGIVFIVIFIIAKYIGFQGVSGFNPISIIFVAVISASLPSLLFRTFRCKNKKIIQGFYFSRNISIFFEISSFVRQIFGISWVDIYVDP